jgi:hypothetical protein
MLCVMAENSDPALAARKREALISLLAIHYIEEHMLVDATQLGDAKESLQALFLRTSGAETMLRRLIELLKVRRNMQSTFSGISSTLNAVRRSVAAMEERADNLRRLIERSPISAEAHAQFVSPFLSFSIRFLQRIGAFEKVLHKYVATREQEVRALANYRVVEESRERLRRRLNGSELAQVSGVVESRIKGELTTSLNYEEAEAAMQATGKQARAAEAEVQAQLEAIRAMSESAQEPSKRDHAIVIRSEDDMHARFEGLITSGAVVDGIVAPVRELLALYRRTHNMFQIDFDRLKKALEHLGNNSGAYFQAKAEDHDMTAKRDKLRKIEALIQFLERAAQLAVVDTLDTYVKFSKALSDTISEPQTTWAFAAMDLLPAKVRAEAELSTLF